jgi:hypothetical protein
MRGDRVTVSAASYAHIQPHKISSNLGSQLGDGRTPGESIYALISGHWVHIRRGSILEDLALLHHPRLLILLEFAELNTIELSYAPFLRFLIGYGRVTCAYDGTPESARHPNSFDICSCLRFHQGN